MKILLVDDHSLFREGLSHVLHELNPAIEIIEASSYEQALQHLAEQPELELVLLDLGLPGKDGFEVLDLIGNRYPTIPVVIVSGSNLRRDVQRSLDAGAMGYITKESTSKVMLNALKLVLAGGIYVPSELMNGNDELSVDDSSGLTYRQREVLALLVEGHANKEIGRLLNLAEPTIKMHVTAILKVLGVANRTQAARVAERLGIGPP